ncbi:MAG: hypothetical protein NPIRA05_04520 [Nitrospirales bacterium]|nr:MAG: hypothetical protein NPIRA05_04520 [Nitrospirales bacterium]
MAPLLAFQGVQLDGDDVLYARLAADMANGEPFFFINTHPTRLGFLVPLAALYLGFGIHDMTTVAFPLLCGLLAVGMVAFATQRLYGDKAALWAAMLCGLNPILYRYSSIGLADLPAGLLYGMFTVSWILIVSKRIQHDQFWAFISGLTCVWAMTTRINIAPMIILTLGGFLLLNWRRTSLWKFPLFAFFAGGCAIGIPYLVFLWWHTGNPLYFLQAAYGGVNFDNAPWLMSSYEGWRFWMRLSGLTMLRASIDGFLYVVFPITLTVFLLWWEDRKNSNTQSLHGYLLIAILSPLLILSHFSVSFMDWHPLRLELRYGAPIIMPLSILVAEACLRIPSVRLSAAIRTMLAFVALISATLLVFAWSQQNFWSLNGAGASLLISVVVMGVYRGPRHLLPITILVLLTANWWHYLSHELLETKARTTALQLEANIIPWESSFPILTDQLTSQYLPYLHEFTSPPQVATWGLDQTETTPLNNGWTKELKDPWPGSYYVVWNPSQAGIAATRRNRAVPKWVMQEVTKGTLVHAFADHRQFPSTIFGRKVKPPEDYQKWPQAGIYQIAGEGKGLYTAKTQRD